MEETLDTLKRHQWFNLILAAAVLVAAILFWRPSGQNLIQSAFGDTAMVLTAPDGSSIEVPYRDVASVELQTVSDYGTCVEGGTEGDTAYGTWQNDEWDEYLLYANTSLKYCMVVTLTDGSVLAVNFSSESLTASTAEAFQELIQSTQSSPSEA